VKAYKAVPKGDLLLPGGPAWSGLRRHVVAAGSDPSLPTLDCIVVVEGDNDQQAVCRAVNTHVSTARHTRDEQPRSGGVGWNVSACDALQCTWLDPSRLLG
jgi:hypothetical protein